LGDLHESYTFNVARRKKFLNVFWWTFSVAYACALFIQITEDYKVEDASSVSEVVHDALFMSWMQNMIIAFTIPPTACGIFLLGRIIIQDLETFYF
jgi:hypothetical protein